MECLVDNIISKLKQDLDPKDVQYFYFGRVWELPESELLAGVITVTPIGSVISPITTGIDDSADLTIEIVVAKTVKNDFYKHAGKESGIRFLTRVIEGSDDCSNLKSNTVRYILRKYQREWGILQPSVSITYDTNAYNNLGVATATISLNMQRHYSQQIT